jgi:hypothetical protein
MMVDMRACYLNFRLRSEEWHRQCVKANDGYYVFVGGMFGSVAAGDLANSFMALIRDIFHEVFGISSMDVYCDNFDNVVPPLPSGEPDWSRALQEWSTLTSVLKSLGVPLHEEVAPTLIWGAINPAGDVIDHHLGWGGQSFPSLRSWVPEKKRARLCALAAKWSSQTTFDCRTIASIVGIFMSLECTLRCLSPFLSTLISFQSVCERKVREGKVVSRTSRSFRHSHISRVLAGIISFLEARDWSVPMFDWDGVCEEVVLAADAAAPKERGLAYTGGVWGKAAYAPSMKVFMFSVHSNKIIQLAKRKLALSSPFLELENYVSAILSFVAKFPCKRIRLIGDCETALNWINICFSNDKDANLILAPLLTAQVDLGFLVLTEHRKRTDALIQLVDSLSRGDEKHVQVLLASGCEEVPYLHTQSWLAGSTNF